MFEERSSITSAIKGVKVLAFASVARVLPSLCLLVERRQKLHHKPAPNELSGIEKVYVHFQLSSAMY